MNTNEVVIQEIELFVEDVETVIAPSLSDNHNETVEVELAVEKAEEIVAPGIPLI